MRVLLIHRYFWPDTPPYASILRSIGKRLVDDGHEVTILTGLSAYKADAGSDIRPTSESLDGMNVQRIPLFNEHGRSLIFRLLNILYFPLRILVFCLFNTRFDIIMASTAPPVVVGFAAAVGAKTRNSRFFYHCMDIHPEIGRLSGEFKNSLVYKTLNYMDLYSCNMAERVIVLSGDMRNSLLLRSGYIQDNIRIINNFSMPGHESISESLGIGKLLKNAGKFRIIFAGNIGRFQGIETFVDAMALLQELHGIELVFLGEGAALESIRERSKLLTNVKFLPHQKVTVARKIIADADLGIVSLVPNVYKYAYPSKTMTYLAEGCPLLVSIEPESELSGFVKDTGIGICITPGSANFIAEEIKKIYANPAILREMKQSAKVLARKKFAEDHVLKKWSLLFT